MAVLNAIKNVESSEYLVNLLLNGTNDDLDLV